MFAFVAARHAKTQRLQTQQAVLQQYVGGEVLERQLLAVHDAFAAEGDVRIHRAPALGTELLYRQYLSGRLLAGAAPGLLLGVGVGADQRRQVLEQQLLGHQVARELRSWLAGDERQVAVDIAVANLAVEAFIAKPRPWASCRLAVR